MKRTRSEDKVPKGINLITGLIDDVLAHICTFLDTPSAKIFRFVIRRNIKILYPKRFTLVGGERIVDYHYKLYLAPENDERSSLTFVNKSSLEYQLAGYKPKFVSIFQCSLFTITKYAFMLTNIPLLTWLSKINKNKNRKIPFFVTNYRIALYFATPEVLKWIITNIKIFGPQQYDNGSNRGLEYISYGGNIECLQLAIKSNYCLNEYVINYAAKHGLSLVKWLRSQECPWDSNLYIYAALYGHIDLLEWAEKNGCPMDIAQPSNLENHDINRCICCSAATNGSLEVMKWVISHGFSWHDLIMNRLLKSKNNERLKTFLWALDQGCPWNSDIYCMLSYYGRFDIIKTMYNKNNKIPLHEGIIYYALRAKSIESVIWSVDNKVPLRLAISGAAEIGHLSTMQFLRNKGAPLTSYNYIRIYNIEVLEWLKNNKCPMSTTASLVAASEGKLNTFEWLVKNGCPWDLNECIKNADNSNTALRIDRWSRHLSNEL